jgi:hypothetical protein
MRAGITMDGKPTAIYVEEREEKRENEAGASRLARRKSAKTLFLVSIRCRSILSRAYPCCTHPRETINNHTLGR